MRLRKRQVFSAGEPAFHGSGAAKLAAKEIDARIFPAEARHDPHRPTRTIPQHDRSIHLRCEAKAYLVEVGYLALHDAVDELQQAAIAYGLVDECGQDEIQNILAAAFAVRRP